MASVVAAAGIVTTVVVTAGIYIRLRFPTILSDLQFIRLIAGVILERKKFAKTCYTVIDLFMESVDRHPTKPLILSEDKSLTYEEVDKLSNRFAHYVRKDGTLKVKDVVAVLMHNGPELCWTSLGLGKLGITGALINFNLRSNALLHCIKVSKASIVICEADAGLIDALTDIESGLDGLGIQVWLIGKQVEHPVTPRMKHISWDVQSQPDHRPSRHLRDGLELSDSALYIYTSGTTGLPKPVRITWNKLHGGSYILTIYNKGPDNVVYSPLPMYHSASYIIGFMGVIRIGMTLALRKKFSVRYFWDDVRKYNATIIQYIGETCRYLLDAPKSPSDGVYDHTIELAIGNGLRANIWTEFQTRFNIQQIGEFYGSTEGNQLTFNLDGKVGSCGRQTNFMRMLTGTFEVLECNVETSEPIRRSDGLCTILPPGEAGLLVSKVTSTSPVDGYAAPKAVNEKKLIRNVKKPLDEYFNFGDILLIDKEGYLYFKDRLGDTFRWKGENVATTEVDNVLTDFPDIIVANTYGVEVKGNEGRAGMSCVVSSSCSENMLSQLYVHLTERLPAYACPKFLRFVKEMPVTGTYKHRKVELLKEGFDPQIVEDPMYFFDQTAKSYSLLDMPAFEKILRGEVRL
ncbi:very long-chain acyl-CoA synthetase-like [Anneissia japonica]|uniref:very long-chain acyl-CoA synthetase-like n=1 Tax=Anneissia japonica TaxID=1529436 RepID=UPI00142558B5|nr:very long-chain acyl-CoA synthetase-like [Anneissia japonica]